MNQFLSNNKHNPERAETPLSKNMPMRDEQSQGILNHSGGTPTTINAKPETQHICKTTNGRPDQIRDSMLGLYGYIDEIKNWSSNVQKQLSEKGMQIQVISYENEKEKETTQQLLIENEILSNKLKETADTCSLSFKNTEVAFELLHELKCQSDKVDEKLVKCEELIEEFNTSQHAMSSNVATLATTIELMNMTCQKSALELSKTLANEIEEKTNLQMYYNAKFAASEEKITTLQKDLETSTCMLQMKENENAKLMKFLEEVENTLKEKQLELEERENKLQLLEEAKCKNETLLQQMTEQMSQDLHMCEMKIQTEELEHHQTMEEFTAQLESVHKELHYQQERNRMLLKDQSVLTEDIAQKECLATSLKEQNENAKCQLASAVNYGITLEKQINEIELRLINADEDHQKMLQFQTQIQSLTEELQVIISEKVGLCEQLSIASAKLEKNKEELSHLQHVVESQIQQLHEVTGILEKTTKAHGAYKQGAEKQIYEQSKELDTCKDKVAVLVRKERWARALKKRNKVLKAAIQNKKKKISQLGKKVKTLTEKNKAATCKWDIERETIQNEQENEMGKCKQQIANMENMRTKYDQERQRIESSFADRMEKYKADTDCSLMKKDKEITDNKAQIAIFMKLLEEKDNEAKVLLNNNDTLSMEVNKTLKEKKDAEQRNHEFSVQNLKLVNEIKEKDELLEKTLTDMERLKANSATAPTRKLKRPLCHSPDSSGNNEPVDNASAHRHKQDNEQNACVVESETSESDCLEVDELQLKKSIGAVSSAATPLALMKSRVHSRLASRCPQTPGINPVTRPKPLLRGIQSQPEREQKNTETTKNSSLGGEQEGTKATEPTAETEKENKRFFKVPLSRKTLATKRKTRDLSWFDLPLEN